ncbi:Right handed beta helix region [Tranquillimonas rosea]|uniref:Right handed beta helix region n=1 Tax=Tranquillimonas rosea TaxID=641238 RepID=A0A1H9X2V4_9RHOB|nr:DUF4082 domain-containing protein [Tranquillimonas rosea]SES40522.1 Right handed beta helix region [Tranquillimonas rosea]
MAIYYVATDGSDSGVGNSDDPFRTINHALNSGLEPGDEVVVRPGTYNEQVNINAGGSAAGNVTLRSEVPGEALIRPPSSAYNAVSINDNYVTIDGFDITGNGGDGIEANDVHHIEVLNNIAHDSGESGIQFNWSEFIRVEGNTTYGNASDGWFSGISIYQNRNITGDTETEGFRTVIKDNVSYDNITQTGQHTDGNGIIIDDFQSTQTDGFPNYTFPTLVENNLVYQNGGKGVQVVWSDNVTVKNNTAWHNNQDDQNSGTWRGEISNSQSSDNTFVNNIAVADPSVNSNNTAIDSTSYGGYTNDNVTWSNNLTFNGTPGQASVRTDGGNAGPTEANGNLLGVNPEFVNPGVNFALAGDSPAINAGTDSFGLPENDLDGGARVVDGAVDLGPYEEGSGGSGGGGSQPEPEPEPTNAAPNAQDDEAGTTTAGESLTIQAGALLQNDGDPDDDSLTITDVSSGNGGSVEMNDNGAIVFTPSASASGETSFNYTVSDGNGGTDNASVTVDTTAADDGGTDGGGSDGGSTGGSDGGDTGGTDDGDTGGSDGGDTGGSDGDDDSADNSGGDGETFSLWDEGATPETITDPDGKSVELGLEFTAKEDATLDAVRFYKSADNTGVQHVSLWNSDGELVARTDADNLTSEGWQEVAFDTAVDLEAGETYTASYFTESGKYSVSEEYFTGSSNEGPISIGENAGVYAYTNSADDAPSQTYKASNYWIDLVVDQGGSSDVSPDSGSSSDVIGEADTVTVQQSGPDQWHQVSFGQELDDPAVVMSTMTSNGAQPEIVRVRNVTDTGFEFQMDEWDYQDGSHVSETLSWVAVEAGTHTLEDGRTVTAGHGSGDGGWSDVSFDGAFGDTPAVFAQVSGDENGRAVTERVDGVSSDGFKVSMSDQEAANGSVSGEAFDWIAVDTGGRASNGSMAGVKGGVNDTWSDLGFEDSFANDEFAFLADMQTTNGGNPATLEVASIESDQAELRVREETSNDAETFHVEESVGYAGMDVGQIVAAKSDADDAMA